jgi:hypothetical protein
VQSTPATDREWQLASARLSFLLHRGYWEAAQALVTKQLPLGVATPALWGEEPARFLSLAAGLYIWQQDYPLVLQYTDIVMHQTGIPFDHPAYENALLLRLLAESQVGISSSQLAHHTNEIANYFRKRGQLKGVRQLVVDYFLAGMPKGGCEAAHQFRARMRELNQDPAYRYSLGGYFNFFDWVGVQLAGAPLPGLVPSSF